jgi:hypothetical protein
MQQLDNHLRSKKHKEAAAKFKAAGGLLDEEFERQLA